MRSTGFIRALLRHYHHSATRPLHQLLSTFTAITQATFTPPTNLQTFKLSDLAQFTQEKVFSSNASSDVHLFYVGRDDVHSILKYILSGVTRSLFFNMYSYDDDELNNILIDKARDPKVMMLITLDKSQSGTKTEKALVELDKEFDLNAYNTHFVIGESATHQISHTKGFVADGRVAAEGSTNWSTIGEGIGSKAQNNTQSVITDPDTIIRFQAELIREHMAAAAKHTKERIKAATIKH